MATFSQILQPYQGQKIAIYGLSVQTENILSNWAWECEMIGLLDGYRTSGELYGKPIISMEYAAASGVFGGALIGVCADDTKKNEMTYAIGVEYNGTTITDELSVEQIPAYTWAIFESIGPMPTAFQNLLYKVYSEFFPTSVYHPCGNLDIEVYPDGNMQSPQYKCELWIPVEKNEQD